jgi:hypothetical protein
MSYNGSGTFTINSTGQPVVAGTVITASAFNALTTDLATGLTTAITKDGQTTTTARITFAQGTRDSTLTASSAVATDASKNLVSVTNTGTGNNVLATSPTITTPTISSLSSAAATALTLQSAGTTAVTIGTNQKVGIGTTTLTNKLNVAGAIQSNSTLADIEANSVAMSQESGFARIAAFGANSSTAGTLYLYTVSTNGGIQNGAIIDSSGNLLVGTTTDYANAKLAIDSKTASYPALAAFKTVTGDTANPAIVISKFDNDGSTSQVLMQFLYNNSSSGLGQINGNGGGSAAFGSYSDIRLKENVVDLPPQLNNIMALRPVEFDWKNGNGHQIGFIAQEVNEVYPDIVGENSDGMLTLTDMNKNDARLIKAVQELKAINDTQAETINALTARIVALENA